jgi:hypothetical protein
MKIKISRGMLADSLRPAFDNLFNQPGLCYSKKKPAVLATLSIQLLMLEADCLNCVQVARPAGRIITNEKDYLSQKVFQLELRMTK